MAKKRKSSKKQEEPKKTFPYKAELVGVLLILISILGFGFGPVGVSIKSMSILLVGNLWWSILILILILGMYILIKRELPSIFNPKFMGALIVVIIALTVFHYEFIRDINPKEIVDITIENVNKRIETIKDGAGILTSGDEGIKIGGGILGSGFAWCFANLFGKIGTIIVLVALLIIAMVMLFDIDLGEQIVKLKNKIEDRREAKKMASEEEEDEPISLNEVQQPAVPIKTENINEITPVQLSANLSTTLEQPKETERPREYATPKGIYRLPSISLLDEIPRNQKTNNDFTKSNKIILERVLNDFQIKGTVVEIHVGPAVTQYEVAIPSGTKVSRILNINKEIALALAAKDVRIEAPIPGKSTVGIEIPNPQVRPVKIKEVLGNIPKEAEKSKILVSLGKDLMGQVQTADISKMPHLLVGGSTGSGKSVCINSFIATILMRYRPDQVKLVLVDPKKVELSNYNGVPHLLWPVVTDPKKANTALQRVVGMMEQRYEEFSETGVKNIGSYNEWVEKEKLKNPSCDKKKMFYLVVIIDELADLMLVASKEVEDSIMRITQMARAAGIHLIVATQRPSTDVITGVVKANIPSRISFAVASQIDSRTILDMGGAEKLLGKGDMLYLPMGENNPKRIQGCFITDEEIERIIKYVSSEQKVEYDESLNKAIEEEHNPVSGDKEDYEDPLYDEICAFAIETGKISGSLIQRRFRLGYNRAARIIDLLEERGIVGPQNGSKPREVLLGKKENEEQQQ